MKCQSFPTLVITGILRLFLDVVWEDEFWLILHLSTAILCACLPTFGPLVGKISTVPSILRKRYASYSGRSYSGRTPSDVALKKLGSKESREPINKYERMDVYPKNDYHFAEAVRTRSHEQPHDGKGQVQNSIRVTDTVNVA